MRLVHVDFNSRGPEGMLKASVLGADGPLDSGQKVLAVDADEDMAFVALVVDIDDATGRVWLEVDWQASTPDVWKWRVTGPIAETRNSPASPVRQTNRREPAWV